MNLCDSLQAKIHEQIDRTAHLIALVPADRLDWTPDYPRAWRLDEVLAHLPECLAGFCAVLFALEPQRLAYFDHLRSPTANRACSPAEALQRIAVYRTHIDEGFALLDDSVLARSLPTVFVKAGEPALTLLLGNLEHLINHKHQLFIYLKELGLDLRTPDLYRLR
jgi:hypothetical protein